MTDFDGQGLLLGQQTPVIDSYTPRLLYPIPRATGRERIGCSQAQAWRFQIRCRPRLSRSLRRS